jgi:hypothetical protein
MEDRLIYTVYAYFLCVFWMLIYLFCNNFLAACMGSLFGAVSFSSLGSICYTLYKQANADSDWKKEYKLWKFIQRIYLKN